MLGAEHLSHFLASFLPYSQVLGADLAPEGARSQFIGLWKSVTAAAQMVAPLMIGVISTRAGGLGAATTAVAVVTGSGALWYASMCKARPMWHRPTRSKRLIHWPSLTEAWDEQPGLEHDLALAGASEGPAG